MISWERITGEPLAWGVLTGVRPTKLAMQKLEAGWEKKIILTGHGKVRE